MTRVGFLNNQIDNRGTGNAVFDYAHYNEQILGNESIILSLDTQPRDIQMEKRLVDRFGFVFPYNYTQLSLDVLYHIKSGEQDGFQPPDGVRYAVHGVFKCPDYGDRRAVVSDWLSDSCSIACVPHIVSLPPTSDTLRDSLGIRKDAVVLGRYGGADTFDIPWAWDAIGSALDQRKDLIFLFANTVGIPHEILNSGRVSSGPPIAEPIDKRVFINTCDGMIHARERGETFGISVGEFARYGKPIITYGNSPEKAHIEELPYAEIYTDKESLVDILINFQPYMSKAYLDYTPEKVMKKFKEVFLD